MQSVGSKPVKKTPAGRAIVATLRENFATNLRALLEERGLKQTDFAEALGVSDASVSKWLKKITYPEDTMIDRIVELLGVPYEALVQDPGARRNSSGTTKDIDALLRDFAKIRGFNLVKKI